MIDYSGGQKSFTLQQLRTALHLGADQLRAGAAADRPANVDIVVILGDDAVQR